MKEDLKTKINELIQDLQSTDMNKISKLDTELQTMVDKTCLLYTSPSPRD